MTHQYSVEQLPKQLEHIIQEVEKGGSAQITRQGERVAVIISATEYDLAYCTRSWVLGRD